jgi:hypothetical protein
MGKYAMISMKYLVSIDFWDGYIYEFNMFKKDLQFQKITCKEDNSIKTVITVGLNDTLAVIGTQKGSLILYKLIKEEDKKQKSFQIKWKFLRIVNDHYSEITAIAIKEELNILVSGDKEGYINIYTLPNCKLIRSFKLQTYTEHIFISDSPIPCIVTFANQEFQSFTINGTDIPIDESDKTLSNNSIKENINTFCYYRHHTWKEMLIIVTTNGCLQLREFPQMKILQNMNMIDYNIDNICELIVLNEKIIIGFSEKGKVYVVSFEKNNNK